MCPHDGERTAAPFAPTRTPTLNCATVQGRPGDEVRLRVLAADDPLVDELGAAEPVNPPVDRADLARRVAADRRVMLLEVDGHPSVVLWVALTVGIPDRPTDVLDPSVPVLEPAQADTAVFHSIWNVGSRDSSPPPSEDGGQRTDARLMVEMALDHLARDEPQLRTAVTLSPVPGLRAWLEASGDPPATEREDLVRLATTYLTSLQPDGSPVDPVARFHLGNGARLWRVLVDADPSPLGTRRSHGVMANYRYAPEDRTANRALLATGRVPVAPTIRVGPTSGTMDADRA